MADVTVSVHFDPCALDSHEWQPGKLSLARAVGAEECSKCGETRIPDRSGGIDRSLSKYWNNYLR